jgi:hypothetical protein
LCGQSKRGESYGASFVVSAKLIRRTKLKAYRWFSPACGLRATARQPSLSVLARRAAARSEAESEGCRHDFQVVTQSLRRVRLATPVFFNPAFQIGC